MPAINWNWGTEPQPYYTGSNVGENTRELEGTQGVMINGQRYVRFGTDPGGYITRSAGPGDIINDPRWGTLVSEGAMQRADVDASGGFWGGAGPVLLAGAGLGAFLAPAIAAGGLEGIGGAVSGVPDSYWSMLADAGTGTVTDVGGGAVIDGGVTGAGTVGSPTSSWSFGDLFTNNPFGNVPPGTTTAAQQLFNSGGDMPTYEGDTQPPAPVTDLSRRASLLDILRLGGGGNNWMNLAGNIGSGLLQYLAATKAAGIQSDAANQANATLWAMYNQNRADLEPWRTAGVGALGNLTNLTTPGKQLDTAMLDPGYQFRYDQGAKQLEAQLRAGGKFFSGDALKAGQEYGQNFATNEFGNVFNRNAALAGIGQTAVNTTADMGSKTAGAVGENLLGQANVRASGYIGGLGGLASGIGGVLNSYNQNNTLMALLEASRRRGDQWGYSY